MLSGKTMYYNSLKTETTESCVLISNGSSAGVSTVLGSVTQKAEDFIVPDTNPSSLTLSASSAVNVTVPLGKQAFTAKTATSLPLFDG